MKIRILNFATLIIMISFLSWISSCSKDDGPITDPTTPTAKVEPIDKTFFAQIKYANENSTKVWVGYDFSSFPMYYIYREKDGSSPLRGFLVNAPDGIADAVKVAGADANGIKVFRYDAKMEDANEVLKKGNLVFEFDYDIDSNNHYLQAYNEDGVNRSGTSALELGFHEVFHKYQNDWGPIPGQIQDEDNYPINEQLLTLQLMLVEIARKMPGETDSANIDKYLSMYVAIRSKEMELDPTRDKLVKNMANAQESIEGTARYVDFTIAKGVFSNFDTSYEEQPSGSISSKSEMRDYFAWGMWYGTGAAATYMLKQKGVNVENEVEKGRTLFDIANATLALTDAQKNEFLERAKLEFDHNTTMTEEANRLLALK